MESISRQLGIRLREYRNQQGLTQEALALNSGISVSFLGCIERGEKKPTIGTLEKLLGVLGVSFQDLFDFETAIKPLEDCSTLEKLNLELQGRSDEEVKMLLNISKEVLNYNDKQCVVVIVHKN